MLIKQRPALVERPVACAGRGQYIAVIYHGSAGGALYQRVFAYCHKDPRQKTDAQVLKDITQEVPTKFRQYILTISVVKRCLHPKSDKIPKVERTPFFERVFAWVIARDDSSRQIFSEDEGRRLSWFLNAQAVPLPYTPYELRSLPIKEVVIINYWQDMHVSVGLRGVERVVGLGDLITSS